MRQSAIRPRWAAQLNVAYIVSGSVRRAGGRLRVSAELVRAEGGAQVWCRQVDQAADDVFAVQEAVANQVATGIVGRLLPNERQSLATRPTTSPAAYEAFLRGNVHAARRDSAGLTRALQEYESALRADPGYARLTRQCGGRQAPPMPGSPWVARITAQPRTLAGAGEAGVLWPGAARRPPWPRP